MRSDFEQLQDSIIRCNECSRLVAWREEVALRKVRRFRTEKYWGRPVPAFGNPDAALVLIGLAPAAHGANRTGRMFTGDSSGDWLYEAMHRFGFASQPDSRSREDGLRLHGSLVTAALRCAPPANKPAPEELAACRGYLRAELQLLRAARVVIVFGLIAFRAFILAWREIGQALPDGKLTFAHGAEWTLPNGVTLIASYHPSRQNTQTGRLTRAMFHRVFRRARRILADVPPA